MAAPLIPDAAPTQKAEASPQLSRAEAAYATAVARAQAMDRALKVDLYRPAQKVERRKFDPETLHPKVKALSVKLTTDEAALLSLTVTADEAHRGAQKIDLSASEITRALGISEKEAITAREGLERRDLIRFHDDASGNRGFYPRLPN